MAFAVLALAVTVRVWDLNGFVTWDEPLWSFRSAHFLNALSRGRPADTFQIGAPGVITLWSGAAGIASQRLRVPQAAEAWTQLVDQPYLDLEDQATLQAAGRFLPASRVPLALLGALAVSLSFAFLLCLGVHESVALLAGLLGS